MSELSPFHILIAFVIVSTVVFHVGAKILELRARRRFWNRYGVRK